jgi:uncharacterized protein (AIM24 family)
LAAPAPDEGLFLRHLGRGKHLYNSGRYSEAEKQLEEACLLRPRDLKVLNLLGLAYFKQDRFEKAEEVYRKLVAESPEAPTLHYNLGLIHFKLGRYADAEQAFVRALDLGGENPKVHFYLGSIYERMGRLQDSIYRYRQAGAHILVRRVQDQISPADEERGEGEDRGESDTRPPAIPPEVAAAPSMSDTDALSAEFNELMREREEPRLRPARRLRPLSSTLLARDAAGGPETARFYPIGDPRGGSAPADIVTVLAGGAQRRARPSESFRVLRSGLMEVSFSGKLFIKPGTIYSYSGQLTFWVKEQRSERRSPLVIVTGKGKVVLTDADREITLWPVLDESVFVEPSHVLACEETLTPRYVKIDDDAEDGPEFVTFDGNGTLALSVASRPLPMSVTDDMPVSVPVTSLIAWRGSLKARLAENRDEVVPLFSSHAQGAHLIRLEGTGQVLVEQAGA